MGQMNIFDFIEDPREPLPTNYNVKDLKMKTINEETAVEYISQYHYSRTTLPPTLAFGHYYKDHLVNVILYRSPIGRMMAQQVMKGGDSENTWELIRMVSYEPKPKNLESYCIGNTLRYIKKYYPKIKIIISYADNSMGHMGYVYQASNFNYYGQSRVVDEWYVDGKRIHSKTIAGQYGTTSVSKLKEMLGDRFQVRVIEETKSRYFYILAQNKKDRKNIVSKLKVKILPYPKGDNKKYDIFGKSDFANLKEGE